MEDKKSIHEQPSMKVLPAHTCFNIPRLNKDKSKCCLGCHYWDACRYYKRSEDGN